MIYLVIRTVHHTWYPYILFLVGEHNTIQTAITNLLASSNFVVSMMEESSVLSKEKEQPKMASHVELSLGAYESRMKKNKLVKVVCKIWW